MPKTLKRIAWLLDLHLPALVRDLVDALRLELARALVVGALAALVAVLVLLLGEWLLGGYLDPCALIGWVVFGRTGVWEWIVGLAIQLAVGALAAVAYAAVFEWFAHRAGAAMGLLVALPHVVAAGLLAGLLPMGTSVDAALRAPGAFMALQGAGAVLVFCVAHLLYGLLVGALYGPVLHPIPDATLVRWHEVQLPPTELERGA